MLVVCASVSGFVCVLCMLGLGIQESPGLGGGQLVICLGVCVCVFGAGQGRDLISVFVGRGWSWYSVMDAWWCLCVCVLGAGLVYACLVWVCARLCVSLCTGFC